MGGVNGTSNAADFDAFYRIEQPRMVALAIALTGVSEVARDLAQDSMVKAYRAWPSVSTLDRPGAWVRRVTINAAMSWHRRNGRERVAHLRLGPPATGSTPEVEGARFWAAVRDLPERQRAVVTLHYLEDQSVADIAAALEIAEGTVKSSLSRARDSLAAALGVARGTSTEEVR
jgi:RNA polymerase sigma-70 factor (ECF subfamily)